MSLFPIIINKFTNYIGSNIFKRYNFNIMKNNFPIKDVLFTCPICNDLSVKAWILGLDTINSLQLKKSPETALKSLRIKINLLH